ncbi:hypothetical protein IJ750_00170 [bacterium]|nr:hypothetical protein [bacterium]
MKVQFNSERNSIINTNFKASYCRFSESSFPLLQSMERECYKKYGYAGYMYSEELGKSIMYSMQKLSQMLNSLAQNAGIENKVVEVRVNEEVNPKKVKYLNLTIGDDYSETVTMDNDLKEHSLQKTLKKIVDEKRESIEKYFTEILTK